jgi:hypothetical protein
MPPHRSQAAVAGGSPTADVDSSANRGITAHDGSRASPTNHRPGEPAAGRATRLDARLRLRCEFTAASLLPNGHAESPRHCRSSHPTSVLTVCLRPRHLPDDPKVGWFCRHPNRRITEVTRG